LLFSNADGEPVTGAADLRQRLVAQVTLPVRWDLCMAALRDQGVTAVIELAPAGTLAGLIKRELKGTKTLPLKTPDDLSSAVELVNGGG
jgi:[acyl-carrier-protein] S-malonyltransferase